MFKKYCFKLDEDVVSSFRAFVISKHKTTYNATHREFENALTSYIALHAHTEKSGNRQSTIKKSPFYRLLSILVSYDENNQKSIDLHSKIIRDLIIQNFGADERTVQKYINRLLEQKYMSKICNEIGAWTGIYQLETELIRNKLNNL